MTVRVLLLTYQFLKVGTVYTSVEVFLLALKKVSPYSKCLRSSVA